MLINTEQICTIRVHKKKVHKGYEYRKQKKFLGLITQREGFYYTDALSPYFVTDDFILEREKNNVFVEGEQVFHKPHVEMKMSNGNTYTKYFETQKQLDDFLNSEYIISKLPIIKLI